MKEMKIKHGKNNFLLLACTAIIASLASGGRWVVSCPQVSGAQVHLTLWIINPLRRTTACARSNFKSPFRFQF